MESRESTKFPKHYASKFRAYRTLVQAIPSGALTTIQFNATQFDPLGEFDIAVAHEFVPNETGNYFLSTNVVMESIPAGTNMEIRLNGSVITTPSVHKDTLNREPEVINYSGLFYMLAGSTIHVEVRQDSGINRNLRVGVFDTNFCGFRVG